MANPKTSAYPTPLQSPTKSFPIVDDDGVLTAMGMSLLNGIWSALNGANLIIPCSCNQQTVNVISLTPLLTSPVPQQNSQQIGNYTVFSTWAFIAQATSTALVTASVSPLSALRVYKSNGSTQAGSGDIVVNNQYFLTYVDTLNGGTGGFVLR